MPAFFFVTPCYDEDAFDRFVEALTVGSTSELATIEFYDHDIRYLKGPDTALNAGDELSIVPAIAGGRCGETVDSE